MEINKYIQIICEALEIKKPHISYDTSHFPTKTTLAQCDSKGSTLYLRNEAGYVNQLDLFFSIAHELRHVWQIRTDYDLYFHDYKMANEIGIEPYNRQLAELDANAFAKIVMVDLFHVKPTFDGFSNKAKALIDKQVQFIVKSAEK
ncbi:MAG: hypothetical protein LUH14_02955 [Clostridiaceae bacterium]|nr:hypothetical protein [Clostridiaceae bacterium]